MRTQADRREPIRFALQSDSGPELPSFGLGDFCRLAPAVMSALKGGGHLGRLIAVAVILTTGGTLLYGFTFGIWRSPMQGCVSALKLPVLFLAVIGVSAVLNTMLAQLSGYRLSLRQVLGLVLTGMTVGAIVLGALSPVVSYLVLQAPAPDPRVLGISRDAPEAAATMAVYRRVLLLHVAVVGFAGLVGNVRLHRALSPLVGGPAPAIRLLLVWLAIMGFVGTQLSWLLSPFLCDPVSPPHWISQLYWEYNFYEYVWMCLSTRP